MKEIPGFLFDPKSKKYFKDDPSTRERLQVQKTRKPRTKNTTNFTVRFNSSPFKTLFPKSISFDPPTLVETIMRNPVIIIKSFNESSQFVTFENDTRALEYEGRCVGIIKGDVWSSCFYSLHRKEKDLIFYGRLNDNDHNVVNLVEGICIYNLELGQGVMIRCKRPTCAVAVSLTEYYLGYPRHIDYYNNGVLVQKIRVESEPISFYNLQDCGLILIFLRNGSVLSLKGRHNPRQITTAFKQMSSFPIQTVIPGSNVDCCYAATMDNRIYRLNFLYNSGAISDIVFQAVAEESDEDISRFDLLRPPCLALWMDRFLVKSDETRRHLLIFDMEKQGCLVSRIQCPNSIKSSQDDQITFLSIDRQTQILYFQYSPSGMLYKIS